MRKITNLLSVSLLIFTLAGAAYAAEKNAIYNKKYPAKYTEEYVSDIKPMYKKVS